ncbi:hypothetical protein PHYPSEUDO_000009 [Phytophthora pseudosyringae]|uniref:Uncharacterized protein n=1 Tax=Phytophthora pseudosyringae TaxID=221518 RepID=A0A8T1WI94_9STRA|nr:hypothetical protein PHYPSEUDO_000009 [Phytophthora pseudosyringae]
MEGRGRQDANAVRRSGTFSGRQVPLEMGKVRVGRSGRPVPAVFSAAASRRAVTSSQEAAAVPSAALSPRVTLESHPRSPFRRNEELSKTVLRVSEDSTGSRFQVTRVTGSRLSARSPQIRFKGRRSTASEFATRSAEMRTSRDDGMELSRSVEGAQMNFVRQPRKSSHLPEKVVTNDSEDQHISVEELTTKDPGNSTAVDLLLTEEQKEEVSATVSEEKTMQPNSENVRPPELPDRKALTLPTASAGAGTFVSSMPSLTKLRSSFTARELALFTQRLDTSEGEGNVQTRYHVASHPHSTTTAISSPASRDNHERVRSEQRGMTHKRALPPSKPQRDSGNFSSNEERHVVSSWKRVDTSIDQIYEDPSIDMVQLHLIHSHNTTSGQKKRKMLERERVLAAASGLREHQSEEQRRQEQLQQRKLQLQKMSDAIRLRNQRTVRARAAHSSDSNQRRVKSGRRSENAPSLPKRKPPVPRLSRNGLSAMPQQLKRKKKASDPPQGGVSASILMGLTSDSSVTTTQQEDATAAPNDTSAHETMTNPPVEHQAVKRKPPATTPRSSKKKKKGLTAQPPEAKAAIRAREERRAIAREYMELQKHSRRIWHAKAKEQSQREQEKRQQQLEILEATRLKHLRLSKKRSKYHKKYDIEVINTSIDTPTKPGYLSEGGRSDKELVLDEPHLDGENDQTIGNFGISELASHYETRTVSFDGKPRSNPLSVQEASQHVEADERVRKLLELREKAAALSARLSGLRNRTNNSETMNSPTAFLGSNRLGFEATNVVESGFQAQVSDTGIRALVNNDVHGSAHGSEYEHEEVDEEESEHDDNNHGIDRESQQSVSGRSDFTSNEHDTTRITGHAGMTQSSVVDEEVESVSVTRSRRDLHQNQEFVDATDSTEHVVPDMNDEEDIDIRSIGVYNIGVVWPLQQNDEAEEANRVSETKEVTTAPLASSLSSSSSAASSPPASPAISRREQRLADLGESHDEEKGSSEEAFEVAFYQQLKNRVNAPSALIDDEAREGMSSYRRKETEEEVKSDSGSDSKSDLRLYPADQGVNHGRETRSKASQPSAGLMRLIRETDDSLSVIDQAANKLYHEQLERSEREKEKELQERMEAEKKALLEKDMALKAVMASITGKKSASEMSDSDDDADVQARDDDNELQSSQYKRLEEIMDEVEQERAREHEKSRRPAHAAASVQDEYEHQSKYEPKTTRVQNAKANTRRRDGLPVSPSSTFWDQLVAETTSNEFDDHPGQENFDRPRVEIDDSELVAQRESRLRDDGEQKAGHSESPPRVHSPRTLSRRLMAAVDYQEAILEAHMQISMMEHAQELGTVQAETITLAQAFKEEMEHNATSHQLALDHATLEKKFDGDIQDVMQQLDTIRQVEEQERIANESRMEQELKLANLRESSVQTEPSLRSDAATSAALCVDASTSPVRFSVDTAVQHDSIDQKADISSSVAKATSHELEYASEEDADPYEETFEKESQMQVGQQHRDGANTVNASSIAESLSRSPPQSENDSESEIQSVLSDQADGDDFEESGVAKSVGDEESFSEESQAVSAVESIIDDEVHESRTSRTVKSKVDESASMDYEDDFEASSPKVRVAPNRLSLETVEDFVEDELEVSRSDEHSKASDGIEEDVVGGHDSAKTGEEAVSEDMEDDYYSSDTSRGDSKSTEKSVIKQTATVVHETERSIVQTPDRKKGGRVPTTTPDEIGLNAMQTSDSVSAYVLDLERRKKAEESLLNLRLQAVDQKYQRELKQLECTMSGDHEIKIRKETLTMAFLAEKANVESLKAASTARYYQDLRTFRSLALDWPHAAGRGIDGGQNTPFYSEHMASSVPPVPSATHAAASKSPTQADDTQDASSRRDEYTDEFASDPENDDADVINEESNGTNAAIPESGSIISEHSQREKEPSDIPESSEVDDEDDFEQEDDEDKSISVQEEEDQYEDAFASMSEGVSAQKDIAVEDEIAESSEIGYQSKDDTAHDDSEYAEDFASISESTPTQRAALAKLSASVENGIEEQEIEEDEKASQAGEISSGSEIAEHDHESRASEDKEHSDEIPESDQRKYSEDDFESGHLEQSALPHTEPNLGEQSISVQEGQSNSEDSSTTKLLIAEVATLQEAAGATSNTRSETEDGKVAKKKAKVEELLQAKERLLKQQKEAFRRDEEKRQVDVLAKLALGVDVKGELRRAKDEISQQLVSEFSTLQQTYPILKVTSHLAGNEVPTKERQDTVHTPSVMSKLFSKNTATDRPSVAEDGYDEEFEAASFEEASNDTHADSNKISSSKQSVVASYEADEVGDSQTGDQHRKYEIEAEDSNYEVESEDPSPQSDIDEDEVPSVVDEEEEHAVDEHEASGANDESDGYENDYENDYENESFDEVHSVHDIPPESGGGDVSIAEEPPVEDTTKDDGTLEKSGHDDEDAYSDEGFASASESFTNEVPPVDEAENSLNIHQIAATSELAVAQAAVGAEESSSEDEELTEAIETVVAQLEDKQPTGPVSPREDEPDHVPESALNESKSLAASVSLSRDEEEESLTKSIEERTARLRALRQRIEDRKDAILAVQKQMSVERRKEKMVAEEKLLCDEMESVERLLHVDEAALALCRQRNRLEMMHLEARHLEHSIGRKPNGNVCEQESENDLLLGFDYVEEAQNNGKQQRYPTPAPRGGNIIRGFDMLDGYAYIEAAEPMDSNEFAPIVAARLSPEVIVRKAEAEGGDSDEGGNDAADYGRGVLTGLDECLHAVNNDIGDGERYTAPNQDTCVKDNESLAQLTSEHDGDNDSLQGSDDERFTRVTVDEKAHAHEASVVDRRLGASQEDESNSVMVEQEASIQQASELEVSDEPSAPMLRQEFPDVQGPVNLLAGYSFVEVAEAVSNPQSGLANEDLLVDFDYVEFVESVAVHDTYHEEDHPTGNCTDTSDANREVQEESISSSGCEGMHGVYENEPAIESEDYQTTKAPPQRGLVPNSSTASHTESPARKEEATTKVEDASANAESNSEAVEDEVNAEDRIPQDEDAIDRVTTLLYDDLFHELEKDIVTAISSRRSVQEEQQPLEMVSLGLSRIPSTPFIRGQISEVGSESIDSRYTADWSVEQSSESVHVESTSEVPDEVVADESEEVASIASIEGSAVYANSFAEESSLNSKEDGEMSPAHVFSGETEKEERIENSAQDVGSKVEIDKQQAVQVSAKVKAEKVSRDVTDDSDKALQMEQVADTIFATVFDEIVNSGLQLWSRQQPAAPSPGSSQPTVQCSIKSGATTPTVVKTTRESTKRVVSQDPSSRDRTLTERIVGQLEIVDGEIRLPAFNSIGVGNDPTTHVLYDAVEDLARGCFCAIQQSSLGEHPLDDTSMLAVIHRHVRVEIDELLAIRAQSEHELERQLQLISDESGAETGLTGDVLLAQNCVASNVSSIVSKVQSDLSRTTEELSAAVQSTRPTLLPRTPISRAKSSSILSSLQTQQDQELQQRVTRMILSDLLRDAGLS